MENNTNKILWNWSGNVVIEKGRGTIVVDGQEREYIAVLDMDFNTHVVRADRLQPADIQDAVIFIERRYRHVAEYAKELGVKHLYRVVLTEEAVKGAQ